MPLAVPLRMMRLRSVAPAGAMACSLLVPGCHEATDACPEGECGGEAEGGPAGDTGTSNGMTSDGASDGTGSSDDTETTDDPSNGRGLPCDVRDVVDRHCTGCHDQMPIYGAPMSLFDADAWRVPAHSDPAHTVAEMAAMRIVDDAEPMPESGPLPAADLAVLQAWIEAGTPSGDAACEGDTTDMA